MATWSTSSLVDIDMVYFTIGEVSMVLVKIVVIMVQVNMFEKPGHRAINYVGIWPRRGLRYLVKQH